FAYAFAGMLPPYFDHLLPEGWLKEVAESARLPMDTALEKLATLCRDNLGAVEIYGPVSGAALSFADAVEEVAARRQAIGAPVSLFSETPAGAGHPAWRHCVYCHAALPTPGHNRN